MAVLFMTFIPQCKSGLGTSESFRIIVVDSIIRDCFVDVFLMFRRVSIRNDT
jgi:hypothetical protein